MWGQKADTLGGQALLNAIDKLVFSALLIGIVTVWTIYEERQERKDVRAEKLFDIEVLRPIGLLEEISGPVRHLISMAKAAENVGFKSDDVTRVSTLALDVETTLDLLEAYVQEEQGEETVKEKIREMRDYVSGFSTHAMMGTLEKEQLVALPKSLRSSFVELSKRVLTNATARIHVGIPARLDGRGDKERE